MYYRTANMITFRGMALRPGPWDFAIARIWCVVVVTRHVFPRDRAVHVSRAIAFVQLLVRPVNGEEETYLSDAE